MHIQIVDQIMISNAGLPICICQPSGVNSFEIAASEMSLALRLGIGGDLVNFQGK